MAKSYPSPDAFPGMRPDGWTGPTSPATPAWALDKEPDDKDYDVAADPAVHSAVTPGAYGSDQGGAGSTDPFPGYPGTQPGGGSGAGGAYGHSAGDANESTQPDTSGSTVGGMESLTPPDTFPGGGQIPGYGDTTGTTGPRRLRRDAAAGGTMP